jgi:CRISPR-associated endonuclease/helicase Cas3
MNKPARNITATGRVLTDDEIDAIADDVAVQSFDVESIRRRGRPSLGSAPSRLVPVRLDPDLHDSLRVRAVRDHATSSDVIRAALREYLAS